MGRNQKGERASVSFNNLIRLFTLGLGIAILELLKDAGKCQAAELLQPDPLFAWMGLI